MSVNLDFLLKIEIFPFSNENISMPMMKTFPSQNGKETLNIVGHGDWLVSVRYGGSPPEG